MLSQRQLLPLTVSLVLGLITVANGHAAFAQGHSVLHGQASKEDLLNQGDNGGAAAPSLNRTDIDHLGTGSRRATGSNAGDDGATPMLDAPLGPLDEVSLVPQMPKHGFGLNADADDYNGKSMNGIPDSAANGSLRPGVPIEDADLMTGTPQTMNVGPDGQGKGADPNDPDSSREMQIAWQAWHNRIAENTFQRWNASANAMFKGCPPLRVGLTYVVTREGRIKDIRIVRSPNPMFNSLAVQAVKSFDGDRALLQFPEGSRRMEVLREASFSKGTGDPANSMRYTTGDRGETIRIR